MKKLRVLLVIAGLACLLTAAAASVSAEAGYVWLEAEDGVASGEYVLSDQTANGGGKGMLLYTDNDGDSRIEFTFDVAEEANYDFKILSTAGNVMHLSKFRYLIDDGDYSYCTGQGSDTVYNQPTPVGGIAVSWIPMTTEKLTPGQHTLTIRTNEMRGFEDIMIHYFDAVAIVPTDWNWVPNGLNRPVLTKKAEYNSAWYNFATSTDTKQTGVGTDGNAVVVLSKQPEGTKYSFPVKFKVPKAGSYDIYFCGAPAGVDYASDYCGYLIDGEEKGKVSEAAYYKNVGGADSTGGGCGMAWQRIERMELDTEEHEITFEIDSPRNMEDAQYVIGLRYLVVVPSDAELDFADKTGAEIMGEFVKYAITINEDFENITDDLLLHKKGLSGSTIKWTSSNPEIISEDGTVTRPSYYGEDAKVTLTAEVEVTDRTSKFVVTKDFSMTVKKKDAYTVKDFALTYPDGKYFGQNPNGGTLGARVKVSNNQNEAKSAILMIVMYDENGAMSEVKSKMFDLTDSLSELSVDMPITEEKAGYSVDAFLWTDLNTRKLIQNSIITYIN